MPTVKSAPSKAAFCAVHLPDSTFRVLLVPLKVRFLTVTEPAPSSTNLPPLLLPSSLKTTEPTLEVKPLATCKVPPEMVNSVALLLLRTMLGALMVPAPMAKTSEPAAASLATFKVKAVSVSKVPAPAKLILLAVGEPAVPLANLLTSYSRLVVVRSTLSKPPDLISILAEELPESK